MADYMRRSVLRSISALTALGAFQPALSRFFARLMPQAPQAKAVERTETLFKSFILGGFESASHINKNGVRLDMIAATQHDRQAVSDYRLLQTMGIKTVRDGIRWPLVEKKGVFDFTSLEPMISASLKSGTQVIWTLCHYGWPADIDVFAPEFITRYTQYCKAAAGFIKSQIADVPFYTPINEISFLSWAAGEVGYIYPFARDRGAELKRQLVRAALAGMEAIRTVDPRARFVHVDPVIHVIAPEGRLELEEEAAHYNELQFEASDMLAGYKYPELGGHPSYLDIMGANFYHDNQWEHHGNRLHWAAVPRDPRWKTLSDLLENLYRRYERPLFLGETSHVGANRAAWMREVTDEIVKLKKRGVPFHGICLYPIIDRPDWDNPDHWHNSGLWDFTKQEDGTYKRILAETYAAEVRNAQRLFEPVR